MYALIVHVDGEMLRPCRVFLGLGSRSVGSVDLVRPHPMYREAGCCSICSGGWWRVLVVVWGSSSMLAMQPEYHCVPEPSQQEQLCMVIYLRESLKVTPPRWRRARQICTSEHVNCFNLTPKSCTKTRNLMVNLQNIHIARFGKYHQQIPRTKKEKKEKEKKRKRKKKPQRKKEIHTFPSWCASGAYLPSSFDCSVACLAVVTRRLAASQIIS